MRIDKVMDIFYDIKEELYKKNIDAYYKYFEDVTLDEFIEAVSWLCRVNAKRREIINSVESVVSYSKAQVIFYAMMINYFGIDNSYKTAGVLAIDEYVYNTDNTFEELKDSVRVVKDMYKELCNAGYKNKLSTVEGLINYYNNRIININYDIDNINVDELFVKCKKKFATYNFEEYTSFEINYYDED